MDEVPSIGPAVRPAGYGVLAEVSPRLLAIGAVWVLIADGVFTAMALYGGGIEIMLSGLGAILVVILLVMVSTTPILSIIASAAASLLFGDVMYHISDLVGFAIVIALEIGAMHYVALRILARKRRPTRTRKP